MIKSLLRIALLAAVVVTVTSCDDILDESPDNRTEIDTPEKVRQLLTSGYPTSYPAVICELSGDNFVDNNVVVTSTHKDPYYTFHEEAYAWEDIVDYSTSTDDTPYAVWESYYGGIAVCNHAIAAIEEMCEERGTTPTTDSDLAHSWGEAHVLRAYLHFMLVNVFAEAWKDDDQSQYDTGIPYVTEPETTVSVDYGADIPSVKEVYDYIEADLLEGIDLIDDALYSVPAYHFNRNAANAFAARFYLFKREYENVITYADAALGSNAASSLRSWIDINTNSLDSRLLDYNDEDETCNFLIQSTYSLFDRMLSACRHAINDGNSTYDVPSTKSIIFNGGGPNWSGYLPAFLSNLYRWSAGSEYGVFLFSIYEYFEYTDKIAGIGYVHIVYHPLTAEETLLCRAEAELYLGDTDSAISDLYTWSLSKDVGNSSYTISQLTLTKIKNKYSGTASTNIYISDINPQSMSSEFPVLSDDELRVLYCILHFRRIETVYEGLRWFDIKRYGINVHHAYRGAQDYDVTEDDLLWNDPRRVLQIPNNVIQAGYPSTDRTSSSISVSGSLESSPLLVN